jgi:hypothetical protein
MTGRQPRTAASGLATAVALCLGVVAVTGCDAFQPPAVFNLTSVNVASLPPAWPYEEPGLTHAQQEVLDERGKPDRLRARWDERGRLTWGTDLRGRFRRNSVQDIMLWHHHRKAPMPFDLSWLYQSPDQRRDQRVGDEVFRGEEIIFLDEERWEAVPISDQLGVILDYGDPEARDGPELRRGQEVERWRYYGEGRVFHFADGVIERVERVPGMPLRVTPEI